MITAPWFRIRALLVMIPLVGAGIDLQNAARADDPFWQVDVFSSGTEGSFLRGERIAGDTPRRPGDPDPFPIVAGYQKIGIVEQVGADVADLEVGETVFATMGKVEGMFDARGGHVSPSVSPRDQIWKLPPDVDPLAFSGLVLTSNS